MSILMATDENFDEITKDGVCLIDFYTTHCGPCRALLPTLLEVEAKLPFVKLIKVNLDYCQKVGRRYMIEMTPTLYVGKDGDLREMEGGTELDDLLAAMGEVLYGKRAGQTTDAKVQSGTEQGSNAQSGAEQATNVNEQPAAEQADGTEIPLPPKGKVTLNPDAEVVRQIREGLKAKDGYCPCRRKKTPENKCICKEFREQIADPNFEGFCHCMLYYKSKG